MQSTYENYYRRGNLQREKNGVWTMRVSVGGRSFSRSSGTRELAEARIALAKFVIDIEREHVVHTDYGPLFGAWTRYECSPEAARLTTAGRSHRYQAWRSFSAWMHAAHPEVTDITGVTTSMADEYLCFYGDRRSAMTCNLCICALRGVFRVLLREMAEAQNPWDFVASRFPDSQPRRELTAEEVRRLVAVAESEGGEWPCLFALAAYTGMRLGDCCRLLWENVNLVQGVIQVIPHKTRRYSGGRPIVIPVHEQLMAALVATPAEGRRGYVLPGIARDYELHRWRLSNMLGRIFDDAGIVRCVRYDGRARLTPSATFHSLRHSFVSFAANAGVPLVVVQAIVGHTSTSMTRHYYHANESALRRAVCAIPSFGRAGHAAVAVMRRGLETCNGKTPSLAQRLARANRLLKCGFINAEEHAGLRERILADA